MNWVTVSSSAELPENWDGMAGDNIFLRRSFLSHLERVNPCGQRYSYLMDSNSIKAICVDYSLKLDIFTYSFLSLKLPVRIMGIPCSVSKPGFAVLPGFEASMIQHFQALKGAKLILNSDLNLPGAHGVTLPTCKLPLSWASVEDFLGSMRSGYRYRLKKALKKWARVEVEYLSPAEFDQDLYRMYEQVYQKSAAKLEKLSQGFFSQLPLPAKLIRASVQGRALGFAVVVENGPELIFLFTGFDYSLQAGYDTYLNLLLEIIKYGLERGFSRIELGQTAEETKLKLGAALHAKSMYIYHSNPLINKLAFRLAGLLSYKPPCFDFHVFKSGSVDSVSLPD